MTTRASNRSISLQRILDNSRDRDRSDDEGNVPSKMIPSKGRAKDELEISVKKPPFSRPYSSVGEGRKMQHTGLFMGADDSSDDDLRDSGSFRPTKLTTSDLKIHQRSAKLDGKAETTLSKIMASSADDGQDKVAKLTRECNELRLQMTSLRRERDGLQAEIKILMQDREHHVSLEKSLRSRVIQLESENETLKVQNERLLKEVSEFRALSVTNFGFDLHGSREEVHASRLSSNRSIGQQGFRGRDATKELDIIGLERSSLAAIESEMNEVLAEQDVLQQVYDRSIKHVKSFKSKSPLDSFAAQSPITADKIQLERTNASSIADMAKLKEQLVMQTSEVDELRQREDNLKRQLKDALAQGQEMDRLKRQVKSQTERIEELMSENRKLGDDVDALQSEIERLKRDKRNRESDADKLEKELQRAKVHLSQVNTSSFDVLTENERQLSKLSGELLQTTSETRALLKEREEFMKRENILMEEGEKLAEELRSTKDELATIKTLFARLEHRAASLGAKLESREEQLQSLTSESRSLSDELKLKDGQVQALLSEKAQVEGELHIIKQELELISRARQSVEKDLRRLEAQDYPKQVNSLERASLEKDRVIKELRDQNRELEKSVLSLEQDLTQLRHVSYESDQECSRLQTLVENQDLAITRQTEKINILEDALVSKDEILERMRSSQKSGSQQLEDTIRLFEDEKRNASQLKTMNKELFIQVDQLKSQVKQKDDEIRRCQQEIQRLTICVDEESDELSREKEVSRRISTNLQATKEQLSELVTEASSMRDELSRTQIRCRKIESEYHDLKVLLETEESKAEKLSSGNVAYQQRIAQIEQDLAEAEEQVSKERLENQRLTIALQNVRSELDVEKATVKRVQVTNKSLQEQVHTIESDNQEKQKETRRLQDILEIEKSSNHQLREALSSERHRVSNLETELEKFRTDLGETVTQLTHTQRDLESERSATRKANTTIRSLTDKLAEMTTDAQRLKVEIEEFERADKAARLALKESQERLADEQRKVEQMHLELKEVRQVISSQKEAISNLNKEKAEKQLSDKEIAADIQSLEDSVKRMQGDLEAEQTRNAQLEHNVRVYGEKISSLNDLVREKDREIINRNTEIRSLQSQLSSINAKFEESKGALLEIEKAKRLGDDKVKRLQRQCADLEGEMLEWKSRYEKAAVDLIRTSDELNEEKIDGRKMDQYLKTKEQITQFIELYHERERENANQKLVNERLLAEKEQQQDEILKLKQGIEKLQDVNESLIKQNDQLKQYLMKAKRSGDTLAAANESLRETNMTLEESLPESHMRIQLLVKRNEELMRAYSELQDASVRGSEDQMEEMKRIRKQMESLNIECDSLRIQNEELMKEAANWKKVVAQKESSLLDMKARVTNLTDALKEEEEKSNRFVAELKVKFESLQDQLEIKSNLTNRLTHEREEMETIIRNLRAKLNDLAVAIEEKEQMIVNLRELIERLGHENKSLESKYHSLLSETSQKKRLESLETDTKKKYMEEEMEQLQTQLMELRSSLVDVQPQATSPSRPKFSSDKDAPYKIGEAKSPSSSPAKAFTTSSPSKSKPKSTRNHNSPSTDRLFESLGVEDVGRRNPKSQSTKLKEVRSYVDSQDRISDEWAQVEEIFDQSYHSHVQRGELSKRSRLPQTSSSFQATAMNESLPLGESVLASARRNPSSDPVDDSDFGLMERPSTINQHRSFTRRSEADRFFDENVPLDPASYSSRNKVKFHEANLPQDQTLGTSLLGAYNERLGSSVDPSPELYSPASYHASRILTASVEGPEDLDESNATIIREKLRDLQRQVSSRSYSRR